MRPTLLKIAILVLAFGLGVGVSACWQLYQWSVAPQITIVGGVHACGATKNLHTMDLSDGTRIVQSCETFSSPLAAARDLKTRVSNAQIAARSDELDEQGRVVGEMILTSSPKIERFTLRNDTVCFTSAPSLHHLRLYESNSLHPKPLAIP